jgi:pyruvate/2-oxoglutarate dehydrogenase complex dihydrolipoamide acyltransferase (E2) component
MTIRDKLDKIKKAFDSSRDGTVRRLVSADGVTASVNAILLHHCYKKSHNMKALDTAKKEAFENALQHAILVGNPSLHWKLAQPPSVDSDYRPYSQESYWRGLPNLTPTMMNEAGGRAILRARPTEPTPGDILIVTKNVLREHRRGLTCSFLKGETVAFLDWDKEDGDFYVVEGYNRRGKIHPRDVAQVQFSRDPKFPQYAQPVNCLSTTDCQVNCPKRSSSCSSIPELGPKHEYPVYGSRPGDGLAETTQPGFRHRSQSWPQVSPRQSSRQNVVCIRGGGDGAKEPKPSSPSPGPTPPPSPAPSPSPPSPPPSPPPQVPDKSAKRKAATRVAQALEVRKPSLPARIVDISHSKVGFTPVSEQRADTPQHYSSPTPVPDQEPPLPPPFPTREPPLPPSHEDSRVRMSDENGHRCDEGSEECARLLKESGKLGGDEIEERVRQLEESSERDREQMEERFIQLAQKVESMKERYDRGMDGEGRP